MCLQCPSLSFLMSISLYLVSHLLLSLSLLPNISVLPLLSFSHSLSLVLLYLFLNLNVSLFSLIPLCFYIFSTSLSSQNFTFPLFLGSHPSFFPGDAEQRPCFARFMFWGGNKVFRFSISLIPFFPRRPFRDSPSGQTQKGILGPIV